MKYTHIEGDNIVIYHKNCNDGFGAALVCSTILKKKNTEYHSAVHYSDPPDVKDKNVFILDFSYKQDIILKMIEDSNSFIIIDHHKTAEKELENIPDEYKIFDMTKCGAVLTWEYFYDDEIPMFLKYIQDRDLWINEMEDTHLINSGLNEIDRKFHLWYKYLDDSNLEDLKTIGRIIFDHNQKEISRIVYYSSLEKQIIDNVEYSIAYINSNCLASDIGNYLVKTKYPEADFSAIYYHDRIKKRTIFSLRSMEEKTDVSIIAKHFGGGGHKCAAGCCINDFVNKLEENLEDKIDNLNI